MTRDDEGAVRAHRFDFGTLPDGRVVPAVALTNAHGVSATVIAWGATLHALLLPDREGTLADVLLGPADLAGHLSTPGYMGSTVGRFANRIAGGRFTLDGVEYRVPVNNGPNALHGGARGFDKALWDLVSVEEGPAAGVTLRHVSPDGDQGFPGTLTVEARYALDADNALTIDYRATTDRPTIVNITNHAYWNLAGEGSAEGALGHYLTIPAERFTPVDEGLIPTGELRAVAGTPFDFRSAMPVGARVRDAADAQICFGRGYDHNWVFAERPADTPRLVARLGEPVSGRHLELWSDQPGMQFYSGNFLDGTVVGKSGRLYRQGDAIVLEPQRFPDTPNRPAFGSARLAPGEVYRNRIVYRFGVAGAS